MGRKLHWGVLVFACACKSEPIPDCPSYTVLVGGDCVAGCTLDSDCLTGERCDTALGACVHGGVKPPPEIRLFTVTPAEITVSGTEVTIEYDANMENTDAIEIEPGVLARTSTLNNVFTFVVSDSIAMRLHAYGPGGETTRDQTVTLIGGSVSIVDFTAAPMETKDGNEITLSWRVENAAPGTIRITEPERARSVGGALPSSGTKTETANGLPIEYWIEATGMSGELARRSQVVFETIDGDPKIKKLEIAPRTIDPGDTTLISWETQNANVLILSNNIGSDGIYLDRFMVARGFEIVGPEQNTTYTLSAQGNGPTDQQSVDLLLNIEQPPAIDSFEVQPLVRTAGQQEGVNATWSVTGANEVALFVNDMLLGTFQPQDSYMGGAEENGHFRLAAASRNGASAVQALKHSWLLGNEHELFIDNDVTSVARAASLSAIDHTDEFPIQVQAEGWLDAFIADQGAQCDASIGSAIGLQLFDERMNLVANANIEGGCPRITQSDLAAGMYVLVTSLSAPTTGRTDYAIFAGWYAGVCGDGVKQSMEACDDGNNVAGDGCSGSCMVEAGRDADYTVVSTNGGFMLPENAVFGIAHFNATDDMSSANDNGVALLALPFNFHFYSNTYAGLFVHTDGFIALRPEDRASGPIDVLPNEERPNAFIAPFMADLRLADFSDAKGEVLYFTSNGTNGRRRFNVVFRNLTGKGHTQNDRVLLDAIVSLEEETGTIRVQYGPLTASGAPRNLLFVAGVEDARGKFASTVEGCTGPCARDAVANRLVTYTLHRN